MYIVQCYKLESCPVPIYSYISSGNPYSYLAAGIYKSYRILLYAVQVAGSSCTHVCNNSSDFGHHSECFLYCRYPSTGHCHYINTGITNKSRPLRGIAFVFCRRPRVVHEYIIYFNLPTIIYTLRLVFSAGFRWVRRIVTVCGQRFALEILRRQIYIF